VRPSRGTAILPGVNRSRSEAWRDSGVIRLFQEMKESLRHDHNRLANHPVYAMMQDPVALRIFMTSHVFAVWDFMTLLKSLQRSVTSMTVPWTPPEHIEAARFINEIVVGEETDEIYPGVYISHFQLYVMAMDECDADRGPIDALIAAVGAGTDVHDILDSLDTLPRETADFVKFTMATAALPAHQVAASFAFGRENLIPSMFLQLLAHHTHKAEKAISPTKLRAREFGLKLAKFLERRYSPRDVRLPDGPPRGQAFRTYLERHIDVDTESHGPMGERLLMSLCGRSTTKWQEAEETARASLNARDAMWHGVVEAIQAERTAIFEAKQQA